MLIHAMETQLPFKCSHCERAFPMNFELIIHLKTHSGEKPFQCTDCDKSFSLKSALINHMESHLGDKPNDKSLDGNAHLNGISLTSESSAYTGDKIVWAKQGLSRHPCSYCDKTFTWKYELTHHLRVHIGDTPYECNHCDRRFTTKCYLNKHIGNIHTKSKYLCNYCSKAFADKTGLRNHIMTHTGEKPYQCKQCHKSFAQKVCLKRHNGVHTGEKPFQCDYCEKCFRLKSTLQAHLRIHTEENPVQYNNHKKPPTKKKSQITQNKINEISETMETGNFSCISTIEEKGDHFGSKENNSNNHDDKSKLEIKEERIYSELFTNDKLRELKVSIKEEKTDSDILDAVT